MYVRNRIVGSHSMIMVPTNLDRLPNQSLFLSPALVFAIRTGDRDYGVDVFLPRHVASSVFLKHLS